MRTVWYGCIRLARQGGAISLLLALAAVSAAACANAAVATLEELGFAGGANRENGTGLNGSFTSGGAAFNNHHGIDPDYGNEFWFGWGYSRATDINTPGWGNEFSAYSQSYQDGAGAGAGRSWNYAVAFVSEYDLLYNNDGELPIIAIPQGQYAVTAKIANTAYAYWAMATGNDGYGIVRQFSAEYADYFRMTITGKDADGGLVGSIPYYLADFRPAALRPDNGRKDNYVLADWIDLRAMQPLGASGAPLSLADLAGSRTLTCTLETTDKNAYGWSNTPLYFALDGLRLASPAVQKSWSGGTGDWGSPGNWQGGGLSGGEALHFAGPAQAVATNGLLSDTTFNSITFDAGAGPFTLDGHSIELAGDVTNDSTAGQTVALDLVMESGGGTFNADAADLTVEGSISGGTGLSKVGPHRLVLSGDNIYTGDTRVFEGTLEIASPDALPTDSPLTIYGSGTVVLRSGLGRAIELAGLTISLGSPPASGPPDLGGPATVPEPGTLLLLAAAAGCMAVCAGRRR